MIDISVVLTAHREGLFVIPAMRSMAVAVARARSKGMAVEHIVVLDRPDALTRSCINDAVPKESWLLLLDVGDPAVARNEAIAMARGHYVTLLDADDLWCGNWLIEAQMFCQAQPVPTVAHSDVNLVFGAERAVWQHQDSTAPDFDIDFLKLGNFWDAMCFAPRDVFLRFPYRRNDFARGYGHEDWTWNNETLSAGIPHRPVPRTLHAKRRRMNSQLDLANRSGVITYPTPIDRYLESDRLAERPHSAR